MAVVSTPRKVLTELHENVAGGLWNSPIGSMGTNARNLEIENEDAGAVGGDVLPESAPEIPVESMMQQMEEEVARRCEELAKLAESFKESLFRDLEMALAKIPTRIRNMTLKEFDETYGPKAKSEIVPQTDAVSNIAHIQATCLKASKRKVEFEAPPSTARRSKRIATGPSVRSSAMKEPRTLKRPSKRDVPLSTFETPMPSNRAPDFSDTGGDETVLRLQQGATCTARKSKRRNFKVFELPTEQGNLQLELSVDDVRKLLAEWEN